MDTMKNVNVYDM